MKNKEEKKGSASAYRQLEHRQQENVFPLPFIDPVRKVPAERHSQI
jgi:hypothetical protein